VRVVAFPFRASDRSNTSGQKWDPWLKTGYRGTQFANFGTLALKLQFIEPFGQRKQEQRRRISPDTW